jgi:hypothetical protein
MSYITIGTNQYRNKSTSILYEDTDRLRHMYMIGKTGVGKSTLFANMALQDITNHRGICFVDPHGESVEWLLQNIPASRLEDVVYFSPADTNSPLGLNLLEAKTEAERDFLVTELIEIFYKLFDPERSGIIGPQFEHWLRNASLTLMADPDGASLIEIPKLFVDRKFELKKRSFIKDPLVQEFWSGQMSKTSDFHKSEMLNYFNSKFGHFLNNALCRNIIGQTKNSIDFDDILSKEKIFLVNLSKGKIGELNAYMLGLILMSKLQASILKRASLEPKDRYPFYLYVDEFQNLTTDTFASMLSESRKYGLGVHVTNQYFAQLPKKIQNAILGNCGTLLAFQVGQEDAAMLEREFQPFDKSDLANLAKYNFYIKLMIKGQTSEAFSGISLQPMEARLPVATALQVTDLNRLRYGSPRLLIEEQIRSRLG